MTPRPARRPDHGPVVGILAGRSPKERYSLHEGYVTAVTAAGGFPLVLPVGWETDPERLVTQVLFCDALLVTGGDDIDPELSKIADASDARGIDRARDDAEITAIHATALDSGRPVLGICRGIQILAVAFGGSLVGDLESSGYDKHDLLEREYETVHTLSTKRGSLAAQILGDLTMVNSAHHQAVATVPEGFRATAWAPDGCIEAIEGAGALGLQWHPERLHATDERFLPPFRWLTA